MVFVVWFEVTVKWDSIFHLLTCLIVIHIFSLNFFIWCSSDCIFLLRKFVPREVFLITIDLSLRMLETLNHSSLLRLAIEIFGDAGKLAQAHRVDLLLLQVVHWIGLLVRVRGRTSRGVRCVATLVAWVAAAALLLSHRLLCPLGSCHADVVAQVLQSGHTTAFRNLLGYRLL